MFKKIILSVVAIATLTSSVSANELTKVTPTETEKVSIAQETYAGLSLGTGASFYNGDVTRTVSIAYIPYFDSVNKIAYAVGAQFDSEANYKTIASVSFNDFGSGKMIPNIFIAHAKTEMEKGSVTKDFSDTYFGIGASILVSSDDVIQVFGGNGKDSGKFGISNHYSINSRLSLDTSLTRTIHSATEAYDAQTEIQLGVSYKF